jgi:hypothetical protein
MEESTRKMADILIELKQDVDLENKRTLERKRMYHQERVRGKDEGIKSNLKEIEKYLQGKVDANLKILGRIQGKINQLN